MTPIALSSCELSILLKQNMDRTENTEVTGFGEVQGQPQG